MPILQEDLVEQRPTSPKKADIASETHQWRSSLCCCCYCWKLSALWRWHVSQAQRSDFTKYGEKNPNKTKRTFKHVDNISKGSLKIKAEVSWTSCAAHSVQASKLRKPEVAQLEAKFDLFSSIELGGAQQLLRISQWELFFVHPA